MSPSTIAEKGLVYIGETTHWNFQENHCTLHIGIEIRLVLPWFGLGIFNKMDITEGGLL